MLMSGVFVRVRGGGTHTHPFNGLFSGTTRVSWYQKGKTKPICILLEQETVSSSGISWAEMQVCTSLQTDNHASTPPLSFYRPDALPATQPTVSKHWRPQRWRKRSGKKEEIHGSTWHCAAVVEVVLWCLSLGVGADEWSICACQRWRKRRRNPWKWRRHWMKHWRCTATNSALTSSMSAAMVSAATLPFSLYLLVSQVVADLL